MLLGFYVVGLLGIAIATVAVVLQRLVTGSDHLTEAVFATVVPIVFLAISLFAAPRWFYTVRFSASTVMCYGPFGRVLWSESLQGLEEVKHSPGWRGPGRVQLIWADRVRTIPFDAWWNDLWTTERIRRSLGK